VNDLIVNVALEPLYIHEKGAGNKGELTESVTESVTKSVSESKGR
jgi:exosome complex RNA-binding protein Rrp42 (RNase PH superfamily)